MKLTVIGYVLLPIIFEMYQPVALGSLTIYNAPDVKKLSEPRNGFDFFGKEEQKKKFCLEFKFTDTDSEEYKECHSLAAKYFDHYKEPDSSITEFVTTCKRKGFNPSKSIVLMTHLANYEWDMNLAIDLYNNIEINDYVKNIYASITTRIRPEEWYGFKFGSKFNLARCLDRFDDSNTDSKKVEMFNVFNVYGLFLKSHDPEDKSCCSCVDIIYYREIFYSIEPERRRNKDMSDFFKLCQDPKKEYDVWTEKQYAEIMKSVQFYDFESIYRFFDIAGPIAKAGWCSSDNTQWSCPFISEFIGIHMYEHIEEYEKPEYYEDRIKLVALAIKDGFTWTNFQSFFTTTTASENDDFKEIKCKIDIYNEIFSSDKPDISSFDVDTFIERIGFRLETFVEENLPTTNCQKPSRHLLGWLS